jgi:hypothetical protein
MCDQALSVGDVREVPKPQCDFIFGAGVMGAENNCSGNGYKYSKFHWDWFLIVKS